MKRVLALVAMLATIFPQSDGGAHPKYVLVYSVFHGGEAGGIDPCMGFGSCWSEQRAELFLNVKDAQERMNKTPENYFLSPYDRFVFITKDNFVGLYAVTEIPVTQQKVGTERKPVTEMKTVDKMEWRVKQ